METARNEAHKKEKIEKIMNRALGQYQETSAIWSPRRRGDGWQKKYLKK